MKRSVRAAVNSIFSDALSDFGTTSKPLAEAMAPPRAVTTCSTAFAGSGTSISPAIR
jgi:hypothetical protein